MDTDAPLDVALKVYIGYDSREREAYRVARDSLLRTSGIHATALDVSRLRQAGLYTRPHLMVGDRLIDGVTGGPMSTEFAISRFLTPVLAQSGYAIFADCDVVFLDDIRKMVALEAFTHAVSVVKHEYTPKPGLKMGNQLQTSYPRKNWSSVMLFNCDHWANRRLSVKDVNTRTGLDLHRFYWLNDFELGALDPRWNWLVGEQEKPDSPGVAHFTLGGPWLPNWKGAEHDEIWNAAAVQART